MGGSYRGGVDHVGVGWCGLYRGEMVCTGVGWVRYGWVGCIM